VLGAPNVAAFAPSPASFLDVADYPEPAALAARVRELCADEAAYAAMLRWKADAPSPALRALCEAGAGDAFARLARLL
jgi:hypothetical protein